MATNTLSLYKTYHLDRGDEREGLFTVLHDRYGIERALYPGCFVHVTPSFVIPEVCYVDTEKRADRFFAAPETAALVERRKQYPRPAVYRFHHQDYREPIPEPDEAFDLLISQYAGFISQHAWTHLKVGGWLVANNSHGDAGMAYLDDRYAFVAAVDKRGDRYRLVETDLDTFFVPKKALDITPAYQEELGRGIGYKKSAAVYVFQRVQ